MCVPEDFECSESFTWVCGECKAGWPGEVAVPCRDTGEGPCTEGEPGQFRVPGDGIVKGEPPSTMPKNEDKDTFKISQHLLIKTLND